MHVVILDEKQNPIGMMECKDFVLVGWHDHEGQIAGKTNVQVHQSSPGNLEHMELAARLIARTLKNGGSPLFSVLGHVIETALDRTIEQIKADASEKVEAQSLQKPNGI